jgi:hypothetical protein
LVTDGLPRDRLVLVAAMKKGQGIARETNSAIVNTYRTNKGWEDMLKQN